MCNNMNHWETGGLTNSFNKKTYMTVKFIKITIPNMLSRKQNACLKLYTKMN